MTFFYNWPSMTHVLDFIRRNVMTRNMRDIYLIPHVQGVVSQAFDFSRQFLESILPAQKFVLKYQEVAVTP